MIFSCSKNSNKEKELELREREIAIKEIELGIKSKLSNQLEIEGTVQKFSPRGYIFKSYEGILNMEPRNLADQTINYMTFKVAHELVEVQKDIYDSMSSGKRVRLTCEQNTVDNETSNYVIKVEVLE